jgi:DNA-directed RNA polymerase subunit RPC12/RpoP
MNADKSAAPEEWEQLGACDVEYTIYRHTSCGTRVHILMGYEPVCPKCHAKRWAEEKARKHKWQTKV